MDTVYKRKLLPVKMLRHRFICRQHKILNQHIGKISLIRLYFERSAFGIQCDFALREIEVNGASLHSLFPKQHGKLLHGKKHGHQFLILFAGFFVIIHNDFSNIRISHAPVYPDDGLGYFIIRNIALFVNLHKTA